MLLMLDLFTSIADSCKYDTCFFGRTELLGTLYYIVNVLQCQIEQDCSDYKEQRLKHNEALEIK